jgi:DNA-binding GntR family transcriptional regulator
MSTKSLPRYRTIADQLIGDITSGRYPIGSNLPAESELCARIGASRHTVREALRIVEVAGLIARRQGSGSAVVADTSAVRYQQTLDTIEDLLQHGADSRLQLQSTAEVEPTPGLAHLLGCQPGGLSVALRCLRFARSGAADHPFALMRVWFPPLSGPRRARLLDTAHALKALLRLLDASRIGRIEQSLSAVALDAADARLIGVAAGAPALRAQRTYFDRHGQLMLHADSLHRADVYSHRSTLRHVGS